MKTKEEIKEKLLEALSEYDTAKAKYTKLEKDGFSDTKLLIVMAELVGKLKAFNYVISEEGVRGGVWGV